MLSMFKQHKVSGVLQFIGHFIDVVKKGVTVTFLAHSLDSSHYHHHHEARVIMCGAFSKKKLGPCFSSTEIL